jgi:hypothetical protein
MQTSKKRPLIPALLARGYADRTTSHRDSNRLLASITNSNPVPLVRPIARVRYRRAITLRIPSKPSDHCDERQDYIQTIAQTARRRAHRGQHFRGAN